MQPNNSTNAVLLQIADGVAWITLNRPERLNAFAGTMRDDLDQAINEAGQRQGVRVVVITGTGRGFSTGADLAVTSALAAQRDEEGFAALVQAGMRVIRRLRSVPQPVIAAINGPAAGAGASLALACDVRIASEAGSIGFTFNRIGLHPDWGATYFLPRMVGLGRATELILSGRIVPAAEAERIGLVDRVIPSERFRDEVRAYATALAAKPPLALAAAKRTLARSLVGDLEEVLLAEFAAQMECFRSADAREGIGAFVEKRTPTFTGE